MPLLLLRCKDKEKVRKGKERIEKVRRGDKMERRKRNKLERRRGER